MGCKEFYAHFQVCIGPLSCPAHHTYLPCRVTILMTQAYNFTNLDLAVLFIGQGNAITASALITDLPVLDQ